MKPLSNKDKTNKRVKNTIQLIVPIFICLLFGVSIFIGKDFLVVGDYYKKGKISQRDIFAPFDFSFLDAGNQTIEVEKNELIVQRGEKINTTQESAILKLQAMQNQPKNLYYYLGLFLLLLILSVIVATYISIRRDRILFNIKNVILLCVLIMLVILGAKAILISQWPVYLIPVASVAMLVSILIDPGIAMMLTVLLSVYIGVLTGVRFDLMLVMLSGGIVSIYSVLNVRRRRSLTKAGILIGLMNFITIICIGLINFVPINRLIIQGAWGFANGMLCAVIVTGLLPIFEILFQIMTNISLLELSDLNQPLLKELVLKAPGTYHHSLVVGNLAESAAEAVGANSLLARVGAYFHDIGKIRMAPYFSENQPRAENKHETLSPTISSLIIINHIKEGAELARKHKLGKAINDIIVQHHGDDVVHFFYMRALEQSQEDKSKIQSENFRYPGPKPQFKEAAIVMLADSVEAASRAMQQPTPAKIKDVVNRIINNKFIGGQLDECDLTLKDLHIISEVFSHILNGIFHTRVEYPDFKEDNHERNKNKESAEKSKNKPKKA